MAIALKTSSSAQRKALARRFAPGLLRPFSGMNISVRLGEIAQTVLSRWPIPPQPEKPSVNLCYLTLIDRPHWLMLRESLFSLYRSWYSLPKVSIVSDGSWTADEFNEVFSWWPTPIKVLMREDVCAGAFAVGFEKLAYYGEKSPYGLKLAAIITRAVEQPVMFVDADVLWFSDPALLVGDSMFWDKPRALQEGNCHQRLEMALRHCPEVLKPPFVNSGIVAMKGELMSRELLCGMVQDALVDPQDSRCEQTIIAAAVKLGGELFPDKLCLVEFDDVHRLNPRNVEFEGYCARHYVNWMRHLFYRDALNLRLGAFQPRARRSNQGHSSIRSEYTAR